MNRKALYEIGRVSNIPTCISNATAGYCLGGGDPFSRPLPWLAAVLATVLFYEAGMVLNDVCDYEIDRVERPERPLPSGRIARDQAVGLVVMLFGLGLAVVAAVFPGAIGVALALVGLIVFYDFFHARISLSPVVMGACRASIYWLAAVAGAGSLEALSAFAVGSMSLALGLYIVAVSFIARDEMSNTLSRLQKTSLAAAAAVLGLPILWAVRSSGLDAIPLFAALALMAALGWLLSTRSELLARRIPTMKAVGRLLAGMSLLDAIVLGAIQSPAGVILAWFCFGGTILGHRKIRGT